MGPVYYDIRLMGLFEDIVQEASAEPNQTVTVGQWLYLRLLNADEDLVVEVLDLLVVHLILEL